MRTSTSTETREPAPSGREQTTPAGLPSLKSRSPEELIDLLQENHPWYAGRGAAAISRMRGHILGMLTAPMLPDAALPFVIEELDTGFDPFLVAVSARALRAFREPRAAFVPSILDAIRRIRYSDQIVSPPGAIPETRSTVVAELLATLSWLAPYSAPFRHDIQALRPGLSKRYRAVLNEVLRSIDKNRAQHDPQPCCSISGPLLPVTTVTSPDISDVLLQDQDGASMSFGDLFWGRPSVIIFFYTRCDNPLKCSLNVTNLGVIQRMLDQRELAGKVSIAGITYDPAFDTPLRLKAYGNDRRLRFDSNSRLLRAPCEAGRLVEHFNLGVNFVGPVVNRHRIELFVLNAQGTVAAVFQRTRWEPASVVQCVNELLDNPGTVARGAGRFFDIGGFVGVVASVLFAIMPKCPGCWAAYLGLAGFAGLQLPSFFAIRNLLFAFLAINLAGVGVRALRTRRFAPAILCTFGAIFFLLAQITTAMPGSAAFGILAAAVGTVWGAVPVVSAASRARRILTNLRWKSIRPLT